MPVAMEAVFQVTTRRYGPRRGYQAGFAIYWASCWAAAAALVGPRRLRQLWQVPEPCCWPHHWAAWLLSGFLTREPAGRSPWP
jgi:hypothetical protein